MVNYRWCDIYSYLNLIDRGFYLILWFLPLVTDLSPINWVFLLSLTSFVTNQLNKIRGFPNLESSLKYTDLTSSVSLMAFVKISVKIPLIKRHRMSTWKWLRHYVFITTSHNNDIELDSSKVDFVDLLYLLTPRTFLSFSSAIFKNLLIPPQGYRWMQQLQVLTTSSHKACAQSRKESRGFHSYALPFSFIKEEYFSRNPQPNSLHLSLAHASSHGLLSWKQSRKAHTWYFQPLS